METPRPLPKIGAPAGRALAEVGVRNLEDVERYGFEQLAALHGVGPKAIRLLRAACAVDHGNQALDPNEV